MRLTEDKISHISHLLIEGAVKSGTIESLDPARILKVTKQVLTSYCQLDDEIDAVVRKKLATYKKNIGEGSREWDVLYRKHFDEEMTKRWR